MCTPRWGRALAVACGFIFPSLIPLPCAAAPEWDVSLATGSLSDIRGIAVSTDGYVYGAGRTSVDMLAVKFSSSGSVVWTRTHNVGTGDIGRGGALDASGNFYVGGTVGTSPSYDFGWAKFTSSGGAAASASFNLGGNDIGMAFALGRDGNPVVAGHDSGFNFRAVKFNPAGSVLWNSTYTGSGFVYGAAVDRDDNVLVTGYLTGTPTTAQTVKFSTAGALLWARNYSTSDLYEGKGVAADASGNVYVVGYHGGSLFKFIVLKYDSNGTLLWDREDTLGGTPTVGTAAGVDAMGNLLGLGTFSGQIYIWRYDPFGTQLNRVGYPGSNGSPYVVVPHPTGGFLIGGAESSTLRVLKDSFAAMKAVPGVPGTVFSSVSNTSAVAAWTANGNSADTAYRLDASTAADFSGALLSSTTLDVSAQVSGMLPATLYYFRVATTADGVFTTLGSTVTAVATGTLSTAPVSGLSASGLTLNWGSTYPGGTPYYAQISSSPGFAAPLTSSNTLNLSATFSGLVSNTSYYAQVATAPGGPFTSLGSTITYIEAPTAVYFEEISSHSIVAWAYASGANAFNLTGGLSGANIARGGAYAGWKADSWAFIAPMSTNRNNGGLAAYDGRLYAFGGHNGVSYIATSEFYDPGTNAWSARASLPANRSDFGLGVLGGKAYVVGGTLGGPVLATNYVYDFAANSWTTKTALATARSYPATAFIGGTLYVSGGWTGSTWLASHEAYDVVLDSWSARTAAPVTRGSAPSAVLNGSLYVVGGTTVTSGPDVSRVDSYDPGSNLWTSRGALPYGRSAGFSASAGGKLYHFGGVNGGTKSQNFDEYDPGTDAWVRRSTGMPARTGIGVAMLNGKLYVAGGGDAVAVTSTAFAFDFGRSRHFAGLQPNTLYTFKAKARNLAGIETGETADVSTYTLAAVPTAATPAFNGVFVTSVSLAWTANGNPGGTEYRLYASTASDFNAGSTFWASSWMTTVSTTASGLSYYTTCYFRVQARNAVGVETGFAVLGSTVPLLFRAQRLTGTGGVSTGAGWGDYDGDGDLDVLVSNGGAENEDLYTNAAGVLTRAALAGTAGNSRKNAWGDYDGDGDVDGLVSNGGTEDEVLLRNDAGTLTKVTLTGTAGNSFAAVWGDYDNDGDLDALVANGGTEDEVLLRNDGGGVLTKVTLTGTAGGSQGLAWGDLDGDGDLDAAVANQGAEDDYLLRNDGGVLTKVLLGGTTENSGGVAFADFDLDGDLDILFSNALSDSNLMRNNGAWSFTKSTVTGTSGSYGNLAVGDFDGDGDPDVVMGATNDAESVLLRNDGGVLTRLFMTGVRGQPNAVAAGDSDGDGDPDLFYANALSVDEDLVRNDGPAANAAPTAPGAPAALFQQHATSATLSVVWPIAPYDGANSTAALSYAVVVATAPMVLSGDGKRVVSPAKFAAAWNYGSPDYANVVRPMVRVWAGDPAQRLGAFFRVDLGSVAVANLKSDATYYIRIQAVDAGFARSTWGVETAAYITRSAPTALVSTLSATGLGVFYSTSGAAAYLLRASTAANFSGTVFVSSTTDLAATSLSLAGLAPNTTYFLQLGALWQQTTTWTPAVPSSTLTYAAVPSAGSSLFSGVFSSSLALQWGLNGNPSGTEFLAELALSSSFAGASSTSWTADLGSATFTGLIVGTTYYARVRARNAAGVPAFSATLSTRTAFLSVPGCGLTLDVGKTGAGYGSLSAAVAAVPASLTVETCVVVRDTATYVEQVTVPAKTTNGFRLRILADPVLASGATLAPPALSTAAFRIQSASVSLEGLRVVPGFPVMYGVEISTLYARLDRMLILSTVAFGNAGVGLDSLGLIENSTVSVGASRGIWSAAQSRVDNTVRTSSVTNAAPSLHAVWFVGQRNSLVDSFARNSTGTAVALGIEGRIEGSTATSVGTSVVITAANASSVTIVRSMIESTAATFGLIVNGGEGHSISETTVTVSGAAVSLAGVTRSTLSRVHVYSSGGTGLQMTSGSAWNVIALSTIVTGAPSSHVALSVNSSSNSLITGCVVRSPDSGALYLQDSQGISVVASTLSGRGSLGAAYFYSASQNLLADDYIHSPTDTAVELRSGSNGNTFQRSRLVSGAPAGYALYLTTSSANVVTESLVENTSGYAAFFAVKADANTIDLSTVTARQSGYSALYLDNAATNTFTRSYFANLAGTGVTFGAGASSNTLSLSTVAASGAAAKSLHLFMAADSFIADSWLQGAGYPLYAELSSRAVIWRTTVTATGSVPAAMVAGSSGVVIRDSYVAGPDALNVYSSSATTVERTWLNGTGGSGKALQLLQGSNGLTLSGATMTATSIGLVVEGGARPPWAFLSFSVTAATGVQFQGGTVVATMTLAGFQSAWGNNVDGTGLSAASRVTMRDAAGTLAGTRFESDPLSLVDWIPDPNPVVQGGPFSQVSSIALTASWFSGFPAGTVYYARASSDAAFLGTVFSTDTLALAGTFSGLSALTTYYARVATSPAGPFTALGSTRTLFGDIPGCATSKFVVKGGGGDCSSIGGCVGLIPSTPLAGDYCIAVMDSAVYSEQVTVVNKDPNGFRIRIWGAGGARPTVNPPAGAKAGFQLFNASVSVSDLNIVTTNTVNFGVLVSSSFVVLSSMNVDSGGRINGAGIFLSSWGVVSNASVTVQAADGVRITGYANTVSFTSATAASFSNGGFYLNGASSTTLQDCYATGMYAAFVYHSHGNTLARTTLRKLSTTGGGAGLFLNDASSNVITGSFISNAAGTGLDLFNYAHYNLIELSTITAAGNTDFGLLLGYGTGNRLSRIYVHSQGGSAAALSSGSSESLVEFSTFSTARAGAAALGTNGSSETIVGNMLYAPEGVALALNGSSITVARNFGYTANPLYAALSGGGGGLVSIRDSSFENSGGDGGRFERMSYVDITRSTVTGAGGGAGLKFEGCSSNTVTATRISAPGGPGLSVGSYLELFDMTTTTGSGNTFSGLEISGAPAVRLTVAPGVSLSSSVLHADPGAVSLEISDVLVATFTGLSFTGGSYGAEALSLRPGSRLTLRDASGPSAGTLYELDPRSLVDWVPDPAPSAAANACADVYVVRASGGGDCTTIQGCVDLIGAAPLTGDACVIIADSATYQDQVVITGKQAAGHRIRLEGLFPAARPTLTGTSIENGLLRVESDSVTLRDLILRFPTTEGIVVSSAHAAIERVFVDQWNNQPGIVISSWTTVTDSSVTVTGSYGVGLRISGAGASVLRTTVTGNGGIELVDASSAVVSDVTSSNDACYGLTLAGSHYNSVARSTFIGQGNGCAALHVFGGTYNDFDGLYLYDAAGPAVFFDTYSGQNAWNSIRKSTAVSDSPSDAAVSLYSAEGFTLSDSWVRSAGWDAVSVSGGWFDIIRSTLVSGGDGRTALYAASTAGPSNEARVDSSYLQGSTGAHLSGVDHLSIADSVIVATKNAGDGLRVYDGGLNISLSSVTVIGGAGGHGVFHLGGQNFSLAWSTVTVGGSGSALVLIGVDSADVTDTYLYAPVSLAASLDALTNVSFTRSTVAVGGGASTVALSLNSINGLSSSNTFRSVYIFNPNGGAARVRGNTNGTSSTTFSGCRIEGQTASGTLRALELFNQVSDTAVEDTVVLNPLGEGIRVLLAPRVSVRRSTVSALTLGLAVDQSSVTTLSDSYVWAATSVYINRSSDVVVELSRLWGQTAGLTTQGGSGSLNVSSSSVFGALFGLRLSTPSSPGVLSLSSISFSGLPTGATAVQFLGGPYVSTFTGARFEAADGVNVDGRNLGAASRVTMRHASGSRAGPSYESDPLQVVDWSGTALPSPPTPTAPIGFALGTSSISWSWAVPSAVWSYEVLSASSGFVIATVPTSSFVQTGLTPNATFGIRLSVYGADEVPVLSPAATAHTLAAAPTGLAALFVTQSSAAVQWALNGNPAGTFAELQRSTDAAVYSVRAGTLAATAFDTGLLGCTSYYYRVRNRNPAGIDTDFDGPLLVRTPASTAAAPGDLSAASLPGRRIALTWNPSATEGILAYRLYKDTGAGVVDYSTPYAQFSATTFSTTTVALSTGSIHLFGLRALHRCGTEESNTHAVASAWALESLEGVRASIKVPATGKKISGNRVLVMAELDTGNSNDVSSILFQYRSTGSATWTDIPAANVNHPNPDREQPFFVHWDVTAVADRAYDLRAVASDVAGASDPAPGTITVLVDSVGFEVKETDLGNGKVKKEQAVSNETSNTIATAESGSAVVTKVVLPAGALNTADATLSATANPPALPAPPAAATSLGASIEITLSNGQSQLSNGQTAAIVFNYPDDNGDGIIDGTQVRAENAEIQTFDVPSGKWKKEFVTALDKDKKTLTGQTPHFSLFAAFGVVQGASLDAVRVYPNPYKPNGGNADEGRPFSRADPLSGVIFDNLPAVVTIKIYTLTGRLVSEFGTMAGTGALQWDGKNDQGEDVASGGYFAVITSPGSSTVVKKIGVIR